MTPLREMDVAVARAMDRNVWRWRDLPPYSTDDLTALAQCVPWLREKGCEVTIEYDKAGIRVSAMSEDERGSTCFVDVPEAPNGLAAALCLVVLAVAAQEPRG